MAIGEICSVCEAWVYEFDVDEDGSAVCVGCQQFNEKLWEDSRTEDEIDKWIEQHGGCPDGN